MLPIPPLVWKAVGVLFAVIVVAAGTTAELHHIKTQAVATYKTEQAAVAQKQVVTNHATVAAISASEAAGLRKIAADAKESRDEIQKQYDAAAGSNAALTAAVGKLRARLAYAGKQSTQLPQTGASGPAADGAGNAALPEGLAELVKFNAYQFKLADDDAVTVTALQKVVAQDRAICDGSLPGITPASSE